jgi:YD repeat-containing protein
MNKAYSKKLLLAGGKLIVALLMLAPGPAAAGGDLIPPKVNATSPTGVSLADGSFSYSKTDFTIGTLSLERSYNGSVHTISDPIPLDPNTMFNGLHWTNNFDIYVTPTFTKIGSGAPYARPTVHLGTSSASGMYLQSSFTGTLTLGVDNDDANKGQLRWVGTYYEYTDSNGVIYTFSPSVQPAGTSFATKTTYAAYAQRIASITYPDGRVTSFSYVSGNLKMVSDSTGYAIIFDWSGSVITAACGFNLGNDYVTTSTTCSSAPLKVSYSYTSGLLTTSTDVLNNSETYTYDGNQLINCITPPGASGCKIANSWADGGAGASSITQTLAGGAVWSYSFQNWNGVKTEDPISTIETGVVDPNGKSWSYKFVGTSPSEFTDPNGAITNYRFTGGQTVEENTASTTYFGSILVFVTQPEGNQYEVESNGPFHAITKETWKPKTGSGTIIKQYAYAGPGYKPTTITDANGNATNITYGSHFGVLTEMQPAPTSGAARPLKLTTWTQRYAYIKNSGGTLVAAAAPVWVKDTETQCQTAAGSSMTTCDSGAQQTVTTYQYGATSTVESLLVKGIAVSSGGTTLRTCYGYDGYSRRISETKPNAGLGSCP